MWFCLSGADVSAPYGQSNGALYVLFISYFILIKGMKERLQKVAFVLEADNFLLCKIGGHTKASARWLVQGMTLALLSNALASAPALASPVPLPRVQPLVVNAEQAGSTTSRLLLPVADSGSVRQSQDEDASVLVAGTAEFQAEAAGTTSSGGQAVQVESAAVPSVGEQLSPIWEWSVQRVEKGGTAGDGVGQGALPLSLEQAEELAVRNDHKLKASKYSSEAAHYSVGQAQSELFPTLRFSGNMGVNGVLNSSKSSTFVETGSGGGNLVKVSSGRETRTSLGLGLSVSQTLYDYSRKRRIRKAELGEISSMASYEVTRLDAILAVRKAWFNAYADQVRLDVNRESVANKQLRLEPAQGLYEGGTKARIDIASAESDLAQAELAVIKSETQLKLDWVALNAAMGQPSHTSYRLVLNSYWDEGVEQSEERLTDIALAHRPELLNLQAQLRSQLCTLEMADADKYPSISASAGINESGNMTPLDGTWNVGVALNWNLFDGFLSKYEKLSARSSARAIAEQFEQERLTVYSEVMSRLVELQQYAAAVSAAEAALDKAKESYRLASARYQVGVGQSVEVSDAEIALDQAKMDLVSAGSNFRLAKAGLIRALGVDSLDDIPEDLSPISLDPIPGTDEPEGKE